MAEYRGFDILDILIYFIQKKRFFIYLFFGSFLFSYVLIYFVIEEQFESTAIIIPAEDEGVSGLSGMLKGLKGLPLNLGGSSSMKSEINRYNTIIFSRTTLEEIIRKFDLYKVYNIDTTNKEYQEKAIKRLKKEIVTKETDEDAFEISARSDSPNRAADITNFIIETLNNKIIQLKISKSKGNRIFLEKRVEEIRSELRFSEDSLRKYQENSGLLDVKSQLPELMTVYSTLESDLMAKKLKRNVLENLFDKQSPEVKNLNMEISEYQKKLDDLRSKGERGSLMIAMNSLPNTTLEYLRRYRQVQINSTLLEFIIPLYEQAKIEEKKDYPILQIIDNAVPPAKKNWPPRTLFALLGAVFSTFSFLVYTFLSDLTIRSANPKIILLRQEFIKLFSRKLK